MQIKVVKVREAKQLHCLLDSNEHIIYSIHVLPNVIYSLFWSKFKMQTYLEQKKGEEKIITLTDDLSISKT